MDVQEAVKIFWREVELSSLRRVARRVPVGHTTAAGWKDGVVPEGENREKLIAWAKSLPTAESPDVVGTTANALDGLSAEQVRRLISAEVDRTSIGQTSEDAGIDHMLLRTFLTGQLAEPGPVEWEALRSYAERLVGRALLRRVDYSNVVRERQGFDYQLGVIAGQATAVRQMLESALREQDRVLLGLSSMGATSSRELTPDELRARLEETTRRQLEADAAAESRQRRKASG